MHSRPAARREVAGPTRARRAVIATTEIAIVMIAIIVTEPIMTAPIGADPIVAVPIEIATNTVPRTMRAAANRGIAMIAAATTAIRDRIGLLIDIVKWIALRVDRAADTVMVEATPRQSLEAADLADLPARVPASIAARVQRLPP